MGTGPFMRHINKQILASGCLCATLLVSAGCEPKRIPPMTVSDLMEDRVTLDGVLLKCNQNPSMARDNTDCLNARVAIERLAKDADPADEAKRHAAFEQRRDQLRQSQERAREEQESKAKVDPYNLPMVPVETTPPSGGAATPETSARPSIASQPKP
jgi:hypothetical protein